MWIYKMINVNFLIYMYVGSCYLLKIRKALNSTHPYSYPDLINKSSMWILLALLFNLL